MERLTTEEIRRHFAEKASKHSLAGDDALYVGYLIGRIARLENALEEVPNLFSGDREKACAEALKEG